MKKILTAFLALSLAFFAGCQSGSSSSQSVAETSAEGTTIAETSQLDTPPPETAAAESTAEPESETAIPETTLFHVVNHGELFDDFFMRYADGIGKVEYEEVLNRITDEGLNSGFECDLDYDDGFDDPYMPATYSIEIADDYGDKLLLWFAEDTAGAFTLTMDSYTRTAMGREVSISDSLHFVEIGYWKVEADGGVKTEASSVQELGDWVFQLDIAP